MRKNKRGQMKLSFGMIFSIFLIIIFIAFAIYGITKFLGFQRGVQIGQFVAKVQVDIDKIWRGSEGAVEKTYKLPDKIQYICLVDYGMPSKGPKSELYRDLELISAGHNNNFFFYPIGAGEGQDAARLEHLDLSKITKDENPYCIPNINGDVTMGINMQLGESLVTLVRA